MRINDTTTQLMFSRFSNPQIPITPYDYVNVALDAALSIVPRIVQAHGDGQVPDEVPDWVLGNAHITINNRDKELTWLMVYDTIQGIVEFGMKFGYMAIDSIVILDDTKGPVGTVRVGPLYRDSIASS